MHYSEHTQRSLERLRKNDETNLYSTIPKIIEEIVSEVHRSLDAFFIKSDDYDNLLKHREKFHHEEGIKEITEKLVREYGEIYQPIISGEARAHVQEDMGFIPKKSDYLDPTFWPKWQAQNEVQCNWI